MRKERWHVWATENSPPYRELDLGHHNGETKEFAFKKAAEKFKNLVKSMIAGNWTWHARQEVVVIERKQRVVRVAPDLFKELAAIHAPA